MRDAELYSEANSIQLDGANQILQEYGHFFDWEITNGVTLLDVGCGDGAVFVDVLLKQIPTLSSALGVDISEDMLRVAKAKYGSHTKVSFAQLDVAVKNHEVISQLGTFSHITSFYCFNWVQDQRQAFRNLFQLLQPGGQLFALFVREDAMLPVHQELAASKMWGRFMNDWQEQITPYSLDVDWRKTVGEHLEAAGFVHYRLDGRSLTGHLKSEVDLKASLQAINAFIHRIPADLKQKYMEDVIRAFVRHTPCKTGYVHPYEVIVLQATK